jgi:hypothetical protein
MGPIAPTTHHSLSFPPPAGNKSPTVADPAEEPWTSRCWPRKAIKEPGHREGRDAALMSTGALSTSAQRLRIRILAMPRRFRGGRYSGLILLTTASIVSITLCLPAPANAQRHEPKQRSCSVSPALTTDGVKCSDGRRIAGRALNKSSCPPSPSFQGCTQTVHVRGWTCKGLFPGEGWDFVCRSGLRRIHYSGGG